MALKTLQADLNGWKRLGDFEVQLIGEKVNAIASGTFSGSSEASHYQDTQRAEKPRRSWRSRSFSFDENLVSNPL